MLDLLAWTDAPLPPTSFPGVEPAREDASAFASLLLAGEGWSAGDAPDDADPTQPKPRSSPRDEKLEQTSDLSSRLPIIFSVAPVIYLAAEPPPATGGAAAPAGDLPAADGAALLSQSPGDGAGIGLSDPGLVEIANPLGATGPPGPPQGAATFPCEAGDNQEDEPATTDSTSPRLDEGRREEEARPFATAASPPPTGELPAWPPPKEEGTPKPPLPVTRVAASEVSAPPSLPQQAIPGAPTGRGDTAGTGDRLSPSALAALGPGATSLQPGVTLGGQPQQPDSAAAAHPHAFALVLKQQAGDAAAPGAAETTPTPASTDAPLPALPTGKPSPAEDARPGAQPARQFAGANELPDEERRSSETTPVPSSFTADPGAPPPAGLTGLEAAPETPLETPGAAGVWARMSVEPPAEIQSGAPPAMPSPLTSVELQAPGSAQGGHGPVSVRIEETAAGLEVRVNSSDHELRESLLGGLDQLASRVESQGLGVVQLGTGTGADTADGGDHAHRRHPLFVDERRARPRRVQERSTEFSDLITRTSGGGAAAVR